MFWAGPHRTPIGPVRFDVHTAPNRRPSGFKGSHDDLINGRGERVYQQINRSSSLLD
jgi:hypothetical protein